jgi:hypothetical protein
MKRLAIIGAGSSGLVTLKHALDALPDWDVVCFEKSGDTTGCWGNPYPDFVSTSTKFTTQFSCFRKWDAESREDGRATREDFFRGDEYGRYLMEFADHFDLHPHIRLHSSVRRLAREDTGWKLELDDGDEHFDRVIVCTGLAESPRPLDCPIPRIGSLNELPHSKTVVVMGGGESAADIAHRLADPSLGNRVFLSLKSGIRVSPRYHPIRGVPSDFLRNRLMLSIHQRLRNAIGQKFVEARIRHRQKFERLTGAKPDMTEASVDQRRKDWDARLTAAAKDHLFNVFHTKSDDFLDDVAEGRIEIIGPPCDEDWNEFRHFDTEGSIGLRPDLICPSIGFRSQLGALSEGLLKVPDFHLACLHREYDDIFLVGFARPIIGNIPTISEMQARLVTALIAGKVERPADLRQRHDKERSRVGREFPELNTDAMLPVEMFPYCDGIARLIGTLPTLKRVGSLRRWWRIMRSPASTTHYLDNDHDPDFIDALPVHTPALITILLMIIKAIDLPCRWLAPVDD